MPKQRNYRKKVDSEEEDNGAATPDVTSEASPRAGDGTPPVGDDDVSSIVQEALELRRYRRRLPGIDVQELSRGDKKKRKVEKEVDDDPWKLKSGGGLVDLKDIRGKQFGADTTGGSSAFATESNAMDTERLMQEYIDRELKKRKGRGEEEEEAKPANSAPADPRDELYTIPENLQTKTKVVSEGNVTLSASMLTAIPEVDLGIGVKLKNIEETERAKRKILEGKGSEGRDSVLVAADRFWSGNRAQLQNRRGPGSPTRDGGDAGGDGGHSHTAGHTKKFDKKTMATDEQAFERFKKRIRRG
ncbi:hypothetical protein HK104_000448 [Borealophlyctis nickersoniae]|nr:hypothetical protein HK104_000448 [Borealophlyctis nickersoniae]